MKLLVSVAKKPDQTEQFMSLDSKDNRIGTVDFKRRVMFVENTKIKDVLFIIRFKKDNEVTITPELSGTIYKSLIIHESDATKFFMPVLFDFAVDMATAECVPCRDRKKADAKEVK